MKKINRFHILWPLKIFGFLPFYITEGKIVSKNKSTVWTVTIFLTVWNLCAVYTYCHSTITQSFLIPTERLIILVTSIVQNLMLIHNLLIQWRLGKNLCNSLIDIDVFLGVAETKFMRDIPAKEYVIVSVISGTIQALMIIAYCTLWAPYWSMKFTAAIFFGFNLIYYDFCFGIMVVLFFTMRVRYLNVALIKLANLNPTYFPKYLFFDGLFWKENFDNFVTFHNRAERKDFIETFKMIFLQVRYVEKRYSFFLFAGIMGEILISFSALQSVFNYLISPTQFRNMFATLWIIGGWIFAVFAFLQLDVLYDEIQRSKLICTYILLKDSTPMKTVEVADGILKTLSTRSYFISIYGMFEVNAGMFLSLAAALLVYITMQLQISLEYINVNNNIVPYNNNTTN